MKLAAMRYKGFVWPHNPRTYTIEYERVMGEQKVPFGRYFLQDMGPAKRIMRGEGEFVGLEAYQQFKQLASVFYEDGPGLLIHPVWQTSDAYFVELSLRQEPRADYVRYAFAFWEGFDGHNTGIRVEEKNAQGAASAAWGGGLWHTVRQGETLWGIAQAYGVSLSAVIALNLQIKNPNFVLTGEKVRVR